MGTPTYEARKIGDTYKMVRVDAGHKAKISTMTVGGALLVLAGLARRGTSGLVAAAVGGGLLYCGLSGRAPGEVLPPLLHRKRRPDETVGASYPRQKLGQSTQLPEDDLDEQLMESFP